MNHISVMHILSMIIDIRSYLIHCGIRYFRVSTLSNL